MAVESSNLNVEHGEFMLDASSEEDVCNPCATSLEL